MNGDGCSNFCTIENGWQCSGGNLTHADLCHEICGDGLNMGANECDDGNKNSSDGCSSTCTIEFGWQCFGGSPTSKDTCRETCGNGVRDVGE